MRKLILILAATILFSLTFPAAVRADGIIIPEPPICDPGPCPPLPIRQLDIRYHRVTVNIENQIAVTHVDQVFYNPNDWQVEGVYIFPIPVDASISSFSLWVDGKPVAGEVLDAEQARARYEEIVRSLRDPALLEYAGSNAWQARIFPIPPRQERRIELEYTQVLSVENGLVQYVYPLSTEKFSLQPLESVSVGVTIRSDTPIRAVYSPSHSVEVLRESDLEAKVGYEERQVLPERDFVLYYSVGETEAFHLLTYRDPSDREDPNGFFLLLLAPRPQEAQRVVPKDVILVLDRSGSMEGEKFAQAQEALRYVLRNLNEQDRFNIIAFSTGVDTYALSLRPADEVREALPWVDRLSARGNTDINRALQEAAALVQPGRPAYLIFLTDGLPTEGIIESEAILAAFRSVAPENLRLFTFGVGYDVDTFLLDSLAQENHGASSYILPGERLDEKISAFYEKINTPVLTDLELDFGEAAAYDIYPEPLPDLFIGSQIIVVGRYRQSGVTDITLRGKVNEQPQVLRFEGQSFTSDSRGDEAILATLPRLWATRKIGYLLNQIRLRGPDQETIDQIVRLSIRYGVVTPYTSYLVTEEVALGADAQARLAEDQFSTLQEMPAPAVSGQDAVQKSAEQGALAGAQNVLAPPEEAANKVKLIGARTYVLQDGIWTDTTYDPVRMQPLIVAFLSEDYFRLVEAYPELGGGFALGSQVIVVADGVAYQVVDSEQPVAPLPELPQRTPPTETAPVKATPISQAAEATATSMAAPGTPSPTQPVQTPSSRPWCAGFLFPLLMIGEIGWLRIKKAARRTGS